MARGRLDQIVFIMAGDDARKPSMTPAALRHPAGEAVLALFRPFFSHSPLAVGTDLDGETNMFRLLALNPGRAIEAVYLVGDDHYRLLNAKGGPDTLPKLERNLADLSLGHDPALHRVSALFIRREGRTEPVPTALDVGFLPGVGFDVSSSAVRKGLYWLMPFTAYEEGRRLGMYGLN